MIFLAILAFYCVALWRMSVPLTGDQKVYLSVALEMRDRGSLLIPYLFDKPNFLKPPFQYWMTLLGWKIFGLSLFGALVPSVLAIVLSAWFVKRLAPEQKNISAVVFASTLATMTYGTTAQMEIWIVLFYLMSWFFYLQKRFFTAFLVVGVMAWIKGPLYPALFVFSVGFKEYLDQNLKFIIRPKFLAALALGVAVGLAWYGAAAVYEYDLLKEVFLGRENFGKMQTHQGSPLGLWSEFFGTLFPVSFLFLASFSDGSLKERFQKQKSFWLAFAVIPAIFFTVFPYRVNTYLYLLTPLVAWIALENPKPKKAFGTVLGILAWILSVTLSVFAFRLASGGWISIPLAVAVILTLIFWAFSHREFKGSWIAISSLVLVNLIRIGATDLGEWDLKPLRETHGTLYAYRIDPDQEDIWHEFGLVSAAIGLPIDRVRNEAEASDFVSHGGVLLLSDEQAPPREAQCSPWRRLKRRIKFPVKELLFSGLSIEDPTLHRTFQICKSRI